VYRLPLSTRLTQRFENAISGEMDGSDPPRTSRTRVQIDVPRLATTDIPEAEVDRLIVLTAIGRCRSAVERSEGHHDEITLVPPPEGLSRLTGRLVQCLSGTGRNRCPRRALLAAPGRVGTRRVPGAPGLANQLSERAPAWPQSCWWRRRSRFVLAAHAGGWWPEKREPRILVGSSLEGSVWCRTSHSVAFVDSALGSYSPPVAGRLGAVTTARLDLTPIDSDSADLLAPVFAKEEVFRFPFGRGLTRAETDAYVTGWIEHWDVLGFGLWMVTERGRGLTIGYAGLSVPMFFPDVLPAVEVGWRLDPLAWGHGYATEAAGAALDGAFEVLGLNEVLSLPQIDNPPSVKVAEKIGMRLERTATVPANTERGPVDVAIMIITSHNWRTNKPSSASDG
jgi:RimJ/RimL family protein N-acetyltransferase